MAKRRTNFQEPPGERNSRFYYNQLNRIARAATYWWEGKRLLATAPEETEQGEPNEE